MSLEVIMWCDRKQHDCQRIGGGPVPRLAHLVCFWVHEGDCLSPHRMIDLVGGALSSDTLFDVIYSRGSDTCLSNRVQQLCKDLGKGSFEALAVRICE